MKKFTLSAAGCLLTLAIILIGCDFSKYGLVGNGQVTKENRKVSNFDVIKVKGLFKVYLSQGQEESLTLEADENLLGSIKTEVSNGQLRIYPIEKIKSATELNVHIHFKELSEIDVSGTVEVIGENQIKTDFFEVDGSGTTKIHLDLQTKKLRGDFSGSTEVNLTGSSQELWMYMSGSSELNAENFETQTAKLSLSGASEANVYVREELDVKATGSSNIRYKGSPRKIDQKTSGASTIKPY